MSFYTVKLRDDDVVEMIDQRKLPSEVVYLELKTDAEIYYAIKDMAVRGAPAIGVSAAFGLYLAAKFLLDSFRSAVKGIGGNAGLKSDIASVSDFKKKFESICSFMLSARPTAVNLSWAVERIKKTAKKASENKIAGDAAGQKEILKNIENIVGLVRLEALKIYEEDIEINKQMGKYGAELLRNGDTVLTHCNAGALATAGYGTALGVIRAAVAENKKISVISDETRPFLQGARLTAWELMEDGIPVTLIADNSAGLLMRKGKINAVIVGADRIASNGDTANKIGTYQVAVLAKENKIPFYVAAPLSTIDINIKSGASIPIEERGEDEVVSMFGKRIAPLGVKVLNFAFDITPSEYISGIITEKGILYPDYEQSISEAFKK